MVRTIAIPRIIVTSSRSWTDAAVIQQALSSAQLRFGPFTLVHAGCHGGGELIAHRIVGRSERFPPFSFPVSATSAFKRDAIALGNAQMIRAGADLCLAFIGPCTSSHCPELQIHPSHGATACVNLAERAAIEVQRYWTPWLKRMGH